MGLVGAVLLFGVSCFAQTGFDFAKRVRPTPASVQIAIDAGASTLNFDVQVTRQASSVSSVIALIESTNYGNARVNLVIRTEPNVDVGIAAQTVIDEIDRSNFKNKIVLTSTEVELLERFKILAPEIPRILDVGNVWNNSYWNYLFSTNRQILKKVAPESISAPAAAIDQAFVDNWREFGVGVNVYGFGDEVQIAQRLLMLGVSGFEGTNLNLLRRVYQSNRISQLTVTPARPLLLERIKVAAQDVTYAPYREALLREFIPYVENNCSIDYVPTRMGSRLGSVKCLAQNEKAKIVFIPGKGDSWLEYLAAIQYYNLKGYSIYSMDLPGQGLSSRMSGNAFRIHATDSTRYLADFIDFMSRYVGQSKTPVFFIAHSTGSPVGFEYALHSPKAFKSMIFLAPFFRLRKEPLLRTFGQVIQPFTKDSDTAPFMHGPSFERVTAEDVLAQADVPNLQWRYAIARHLPGAMNRWVTIGWVRSLFEMNSRIQRLLPQLQTPFTVFEAELDEVVDNDGDNNQRMDMIEKSRGLGRSIFVKGAPHQLQRLNEKATRNLIEQIDQIMTDAITH